MSWHYSQALVEEFSERGLLVTAASVRLNTNRTASRSCFGDKRKGRSTHSQSGTTSDHLTVNLGMASSMSCLLDSLANPSAWQGPCEEKTTTETFGLIQRESLAKYDPELSSWRTHQDCFGCTEPLSSVTLAAWGMTVGGGLYPLAPQVPPISGSDGGVWPTPRSSNVSESPESGKARMDLRRSEGRRDGGVRNLESEVKMWPTPCTTQRPSEGSMRLMRQRVLDGSISEAEGAGMLNGKSPLEAHARLPRWPTPQSRDWKNADGKRFPDPERPSDLNDAVDFMEASQGRLNPSWVEFVMGWPVGWTSLDPLPEGTMEAWETSVKAGTYWDVDPADTGEVPRLTDKKENRVSRLKAIGNGQVPAQVLLAWEVLL